MCGVIILKTSGFGRNISKWAGKKTVLPSNVLSLPLVGENKGHPAVFPVDLPLFFIQLLCPPDGMVADPFAASGSTSVAALHAGRRCLLIDNNQLYCDGAAERIARECLPRIPRLAPRAATRTATGYAIAAGASEQPMLFDTPGKADA